MEKNLFTLISEESAKNVGRYNFSKEKEKNVAHHNICKKLIELHEKYNFPMGVLLYIAIGTSAHKVSNFMAKYNRINEKKAIAVIEMCDIFAKKFGEKYRTNDRIVHTMSRFYDLGGKKTILKKHLNSCGIDTLPKFATAKELAAILFKDSADFSERGYVSSFNLNK